MFSQLYDSCPLYASLISVFVMTYNYYETINLCEKYGRTISLFRNNLTSFLIHFADRQLRARRPAPVRGPPLWEALMYGALISLTYIVSSRIHEVLEEGTFLQPFHLCRTTVLD